MPLPANWRDLGLVMATSTMVGAMHSLSYPLLSLVLEREGLAAWLIGLNAAASGFGIFAIAPWIGPLTSRLGAVRCMQAGIVLAALCVLLLPLRVDFTTWLVLRFLLGTGGALVFVVSEAAVNALAEERLRGRILGAYATLFSLGFAAGPLVIALVGSEGVLPFVLGAGLLLAGLVPASLARRADAALAAPSGGGRRLRLLAIWRLAPLALGAALLFANLEAAHFALLPVYGLAVGLAEPAAAMLLSVWIAGNVLFQMPIGWLADRLPRRRVLIGAAAAGLLGLLLVPLAVASPALLWPLLLVQGGCMGALYTLSLTLLGERFSGAELPVANTAFVMTMNVGLILGPALGGVAMTAAGPHGLPLGLAALVALFLVLCRPGWRRPAGARA